MNKHHSIKAKSILLLTATTIAALSLVGNKQSAKAATSNPFLIGMFDPAGTLNVVNPLEPTGGFQTMLNDIKQYGFNAVALNNGDANTESKLLSISDASNFKVILGPQSELKTQWWRNTAVSTTVDATRIVSPLLAKLSTHPSLLAYNLGEDGDGYKVEKVNALMQAVKGIDPARAPGLINGIRFNSNTLTVDRFDSQHYDGTPNPAAPNEQLI